MPLLGSSKRSTYQLLQRLAQLHHAQTAIASLCCKVVISERQKKGVKLTAGGLANSEPKRRRGSAEAVL